MRADPTSLVTVTVHDRLYFFKYETKEVTSHVLGVICVTVTIRSLHASTSRTAVTITLQPSGSRPSSSHSSQSTTPTSESLRLLPLQPLHHRKMYIGAVAAAQISSNSRDYDLLEWLENAMKVSCKYIYSYSHVSM